MSEQSRDYRVGLFVFLGLVILGMLIVLYGEEPTWLWQTKWQLAINVDTPRGIEEGTPAYLQGVQVGRVQEIRLQNMEQPSQGAAVIVEVDEQYAVPSGSSAELHAKFGFDKGSIYIIPPAQPRAAVSQDGTAMIPGQMLGALESIVPEEYVAQLGKAVEEISKIGEIGKFGKVADDLHELLRIRSMEEVDDGSRNVLANFHTLVQRVDETFRVVNDVVGSGGESDLRVALSNVREASQSFKNWTNNLEGQTQSMVDQAGSTLQAVEKQVGDVARSMADTLTQLSQIMDEIYKTARAINQGQGAVGKLVHDPQLYEELLVTVAKLQLALDELTQLSVTLEEEGLLKLR